MCELSPLCNAAEGFFDSEQWVFPLCIHILSNVCISGSLHLYLILVPGVDMIDDLFWKQENTFEYNVSY